MAERPQKNYVGDYGSPLAETPHKQATSAGMVLLAVAIGFVVGFFVWGAFALSSMLTLGLWNGMHGFFNGVVGSSWWVSIPLCTLGGLVIGLWTKFFGGAPKSLEVVLGTVKKTGDYRIDGVGQSVVGFLLPLVFGGSIGPEAGLTGLAAAACCWISRTLKSAGLKVKSVADITVSASLSAIFGTPLAGIVGAAQDAMPDDDREGAPNPDDYDFRRWAKIALYTAAAFGAVIGAMGSTALLQYSGGLPRFEGIEPQLEELWWCIPCVVLGYVLTLLFHAGNTGFGKLSGMLGERPVVKPLLAGVVLGLCGAVLPYVLFPGEEQAFEVMGEWRSLGIAVLLATALVKMLATTLCLNMGWKGGSFFPCIFSGVCGGYAIALMSGVDPMFCVAIVTAITVAGMMRKPVGALAILILCFPVKSLIWMGLACLAGAFLPLPKALLKR